MEGQVNNYKSIAGTKKDIRDRLLKEMEVAKKALTDLLKEELANQAEPEGDVDKDKVIRDTIGQLNFFLQEDKLPTPKDGDQEDQSDPNIYTNELQTIRQQAQEKFKYIYHLADRATKAINDEKQARIEYFRTRN